jgi:hypothetical protein
LQENVRNKERKRDEKVTEVYDEREHRANELRIKNEEKIKQALSRE